jgi:glyoxylase-like metal-dependent hydrolase (beta-lactamase superfamily II)
MPITRRDVLKGTAALSVLGATPNLSIAQINLGQATLSTVSDGNLVLPGDFIFQSVPQDDLAPILSQFNLSRDQLTPECNLALYQNGENNILFDVGSGPDFMPSAGMIVDSLESLGLSPEDITHVIFTHAHPDHLWGLLDDFDDPLFSEARYLIGQDEWDYWWNPNTVDGLSDSLKPFAVGAKRRFEVIEDVVEFFNDGQEILPGIAAVSSPGHTPGHMSFEVRSGSTSTMILGDAIGNHHIAFKKPSWPSGSDQNRETAITSRKMLFDRITNEDMNIIGFHLPNGGIGKVGVMQDGYEFLEGEI